MITAEPTQNCGDDSVLMNKPPDTIPIQHPQQYSVYWEHAQVSGIHNFSGPEVDLSYRHCPKDKSLYRVYTSYDCSWAADLLCTSITTGLEWKPNRIICNEQSSQQRGSSGPIGLSIQELDWSMVRKQVGNISGDFSQPTLKLFNYSAPLNTEHCTHRDHPTQTVSSPSLRWAPPSNSASGKLQWLITLYLACVFAHLKKTSWNNSLPHMDFFTFLQSIYCLKYVLLKIALIISQIALEMDFYR